MSYDPTHLPETDVIGTCLESRQDAGPVRAELSRLYAHCLIRDEVERREQIQRDAELEDNRERARVVIRDYFADPTREKREAAKEAAYRFGWKHSQAANDAYDKIATKCDPRADFTVSPAYVRWFRENVEPEWRALIESSTLTTEPT